MSRVFVKKPIQIEAFRYGFDQEPEWCLKSPSVNHCESATLEWLEIETLEGKMKVGHGDYVIKGIKGEIYPCKADIFEESYDEVHPHFRVKPDVIFDMTAFKTPSVLMPLTEE